MFNITDEAQIYVADLFAQQDEEGLGLKVDIEKAGTPAAAVTFNFCYEKDLGKTYFKFEYKGFDAFIDEANFDYLKDSEVALKEEGSSKKLTITAPRMDLSSDGIFNFLFKRRIFFGRFAFGIGCSDSEFFA
jgi:Fe/S biogenesis protein NfuA